MRGNTTSAARARRRSRAGLAALAVLLVGLTAACTQTGPPPARPTEPGKVEIRYGPFTVPDRNSPAKGIYAGIVPWLGVPVGKGMIWNQPVTNIRKPCIDCFITSMKPGLVYEDGAVANTDTGLWLHHMVLLNQGPGRADPTCAGSALSLPHFAVGTSPANTERIWASGNERSPLPFNLLGDYGYQVNAADRFHLIVDLMNENTTAKTVYLTIEYQYAPLSSTMRDVQPVWLDAAQCGTSETPAKTGVYQVSSVPWRFTVAGRVVLGGGHLHDGGTNLTIDRNGQTVCDSVATYGGPAGGGMDHGGGGMNHGGMNPGGGQHIIAMSPCPFDLTFDVGDMITIHGHYDDVKHPQMNHDGALHSVMAIAILYLAQP
jgi:hypothetical protein